MLNTAIIIFLAIWSLYNLWLWYLIPSKIVIESSTRLMHIYNKIGVCIYTVNIDVDQEFLINNTKIVIKCGAITEVNQI